MGSILPLGKLFRVPSPSQPSYTPPPATTTTNTNSGNNSGNNAGGGNTTTTPPAEPDPQDVREKNLDGQRFGLSGLIGTSLHGLLNFTGKLPQRKTLLGE